jgi:hypothetical protein
VAESPAVRRLVLVSLVLPALVTACGNERQRPPDPSQGVLPRGAEGAYFPESGIRFRRPANWEMRSGHSPLVATVGSGPAVVAVWRYRRREPLPRGRAELAAARRGLVAAARARDRTLRLSSARTTRARGNHAIELLATERIAGHTRRVRSTHIFASGGEVVIDAYAPVAQFDRFDRTAFRSLLLSLRLFRPHPA